MEISDPRQRLKIMSRSQFHNITYRETSSLLTTNKHLSLGDLITRRRKQVLSPKKAFKSPCNKILVVADHFANLYQPEKCKSKLYLSNLKSILRVLERDIIWQQWVVAPISISILAAIGAWEDTDIWDKHFCYFPSVVLITTEHELLSDWMYIACIGPMKYIKRSAKTFHIGVWILRIRKVMNAI